MYTVLLVDPDQDRAEAISRNLPTDWKVRRARTSAEVQSLLAEDQTIARLICASRFGCNETAGTLHAEISDQLEALRIHMIVLIWEEEPLDSLEELYLDAHGVDLVNTSEEVKQALVPTVANLEYA